jgi:ribosome-binding factor A
LRLKFESHEDIDGRQKAAITKEHPNSPMSRRPHRDHAAGASQRQLRVGELIRHEIADMLARGEVHDPVIEHHMITIPEVRVSADLRLATIYVMPLGGRDEQEVLGALERNSRYVRGEIARRVNLKFAPEIRFRLDERFDEAERIEKLLRTPAVQRDLRNRSDK